MTLHSSVTRKVAIDNFYTLEKRFNKIHNDKYSYENAIFINTKSKITITCPEHGDFDQTVGNHLSGKGCICCAGKAVKTTKQFITDAEKHHGTTYDYSKVVYESAKSKVEIICKQHGSFWMSPNAHLGYYKQGCPECGKIKQIDSQIDDTNTFIIKAKTVHNDTYNYSKVNYVRSNINVTITCPVHGDFEQRPNSHLMGSGCTQCTKTGFNPGKPAILYTFKINSVYKIGVTNRSVQERYNVTDFKQITDLKQIYFASGETAYALEQYLKTQYTQYKYLGDTPFTDGTSITECFTTHIQIDSFSDNCSDIPQSWSLYPKLKKLSTTFLSPYHNPVDVPGTTDISME